MKAAAICKTRIGGCAQHEPRMRIPIFVQCARALKWLTKGTRFYIRFHYHTDPKLN